MYAEFGARTRIRTRDQLIKSWLPPYTTELAAHLMYTNPSAASERVQPGLGQIVARIVAGLLSPIAVAFLEFLARPAPAQVIASKPLVTNSPNRLA